MASGKTIPFPAQVARFSVVVAKCGQPEVHLTLVAPEKDPELQRLEKQGRVMSVHQARRGPGTDYGVVGLLPERGAQLLVFPKSLRRFAGKRIVGLNYDLLADTTHVTGDKPTVLARPKRAKASPKLHALRKPQPKPVAREKLKLREVPTPAAVELMPEPPPTMRTVLREILTINRLSRVKQYAAAREAGEKLARRIQIGLSGANARL